MGWNASYKVYLIVARTMPTIGELFLLLGTIQIPCFCTVCAV